MNADTMFFRSQWVPAVAEAGGKLYTFHLEAVCKYLSRHFRVTADAVLAPLPCLSAFALSPSLLFTRTPLAARYLLPPPPRRSLPADPLPVIESIHSHHMLAGLAISPQTPASAITPEAYAAADMILVMTVHPGKGGQKFMPECLEKVKELRDRFGWEKDVQVDGGVGPGNICQCAQAGTYFPLSGISPFCLML